MDFERNARFKQILTGAILGLAGLCLIAMTLGRYSMNPADSLRVLYEWLTGAAPVDSAMWDILFIIRIPRIIAAVLVGAALSLSGAVYQGVFKNPLVSPDLLGVSSGASVGAAIAILFGAGMGLIQLSAFIMGMVAVGTSVTITRFIKNQSNLALVLAGIITSGFMASANGALKYIANPETQLQEIVFWQMGSLASINPGHIASVSPMMLLCGMLMLALSWRINILSFGDDEAKSLGMNVTLYRGITIAGSSLLTASAVSISGTIGWVGLIIPHLGRLLVGSDNVKLLPAAALTGAMFMLVVDTISRAATTVEIPLSILTGFIGAPFFAWLLWKQKEGVQ